MFDNWLFYGIIILVLLVYTSLIMYIFWRIGFNRGYEKGRSVARREIRRHYNRTSRSYEQDTIRVLPYQTQQKCDLADRPIYINRGVELVK
mgnify:CR=1 FL=1